MTTDRNQRSPYEDIIHLPHHVSKKWAQMALRDRAAQFAPFAALTGHDAAVQETARLTQRKIQLDENEFALLDQKLQWIAAQTEPPFVVITYFVPDERKAGGSYVELEGKIRRIDYTHRSLIMEDGIIILIENILRIAEKRVPY